MYDSLYTEIKGENRLFIFNPLHRIFSPAKSSKTYNCDKTNQPKASNSTTDGEDQEGQETNLGKTTSFVDLQFSLKQEYEMRILAPIELR